MKTPKYKVGDTFKSDLFVSMRRLEVGIVNSELKIIDIQIVKRGIIFKKTDIYYTLVATSSNILLSTTFTEPELIDFLNNKNK